VTVRGRRDVGAILRDALALYRARFGLYLALALVVVVPVDVIVFGIGLRQITSGYEEHPSDASVVLQIGVSLLVTAPLVTAMVVSALVRAAPSFREAAQRGLELFAPVLGVTILYVAASLAGLLLLIVGSIVVAVRLYVAVTAAVVEGARGTGALRRSWELTEGSGWRVFGFVILLQLGVAIFSAIVTLPTTALARSADAEVIALVGNMVAEALTLPVAAIATALLYFDLVERRETPA